MKAEFVIPGEPCSKSRHRMGTRGGKVYSYKDEKTTKAQEAVGYAYRAVAGDIGEAEAISGFTVDMTFHVQRRQRRDVDNFVKLVLDGLTGLVWKDDSQVTDIAARVRHGSDDPRTLVVIETNEHLPDWSRGVCQRCGGQFRSYASWANKKKFCSPECRYASRRRDCDQCGKNYLPHKNNRHAASRFCSHDCYRASQRVQRRCGQCGAEVTVPRSKNRAGEKFCSDACRAEYWRLNRKSAAEGVCADCGGPTSKRTYVRCRACFERKGPLDEMRTERERLIEREQKNCPHVKRVLGVCIECGDGAR